MLSALSVYIAALSSILVSITTSPVIAALYLVLTFVAVSAYLIVSGAAFLGLVYLLVYVGAIAVLFLFVVILLDTQAITVSEATTKSSFSYELAFALLVAASVTALVALSPATTWESAQWVFSGPLITNSTVLPIGSVTQVYSLGTLLFSQILLPVLAIAFLLLFSIIGAIILCLRN
jgi:NADH:ubiquinone oxidoreductase subunit 6 (subunit J)